MRFEGIFFTRRVRAGTVLEPRVHLAMKAAEIVLYKVNSIFYCLICSLSFKMWNQETPCHQCVLCSPLPRYPLCRGAVFSGWLPFALRFLSLCGVFGHPLFSLISLFLLHVVFSSAASVTRQNIQCFKHCGGLFCGDLIRHRRDWEILYNGSYRGDPNHHGRREVYFAGYSLRTYFFFVRFLLIQMP